MATVITWVFQSCCCCCAEKAVCVRRSSSTAEEFQKSSWQIAGRTPTGTFATYTFTSSQNFYSFHHFAGEKTCWKKPVINALRRVLKCHLKKIEQQVFNFSGLILLVLALFTLLNDAYKVWIQYVVYFVIVSLPLAKIIKGVVYAKLNNYRWLYIILYLCTLEILPVVLLWHYFVGKIWLFNTRLKIQFWP